MKLLIHAAVVFALSFARAAEVKPGVPVPREVLERVKPFMEESRRALAAMDEAGVRAACSNAMAELGPWAGNPETETVYAKKKLSGTFNTEAVRRSWFREIERGEKMLPWVNNPNGDPRKMEAGLRAAAVPLEALARTVPFAPEQRERIQWMGFMGAGAEWLLKRQHASGVFPMPVGPSLFAKDKVGLIMQRMLKKRPELLVDGWIADFPEDGGLQFDNGLCGSAMIAAWRVTKDERYLASASRAADWAMRQPLVANWNYNAFSVGLLANVAMATGDTNYLAAAVTKARVGVLPGQMQNGRWFDPHNASAVYHNILLRDLLSLYEALPAEHPFRATVRDALVRGLDNAADETVAKGFTGRWTANFARALRLLGENESWREALNICVQSALATSASSLGFDAVGVLELTNERRN